MRTPVLVRPCEFELQEERLGEPSAGEVRVRVLECGICGSDLKMYSGGHPVLSPPLVLGHEVVGVIDAVGAPDLAVSVGETVAIFPPVGCGTCRNCRRDEPHLCRDMALIGGARRGGLSEAVIVPAANVVSVPDRVPEQLRVLTEPVAVAVHAVARAEVAASETSVVVGAGPIGLFVALVLRATTGQSPALVDTSPERRALAAAFGFGEAIDPGGEQLAVALERAGLDAPDVVFECVGSGAVLRQAIAASVRGGRVVLVGVPAREVAVDTVELQRGERSLVSSMMYTREEFRHAMELMAAGLIPDQAIDRGLVRQTLSLEDTAEAFERLANGSSAALKLVVAT